MSYVALYRKFRPSTFSEVKGQDHVVKTLKNQIENNRIGHAYIFTGTRGTGKTSVAKLFAKVANCENPVNGDPCGKCPSCEKIQNGSSLNVIEIDAASNNGVDDARQIIEAVKYAPVDGKYKIYIIDEAHMLSNSACNALLKTLEEPPAYAMFILATTEVNKLPITILSRCQRYDFKRITIDTIAARISELMEKEDRKVEEKAIRYIAKVADGSLRDALSLLDRCLAFYFEGELTYEKALEVLGAVDTSVFSKMLAKIENHDTIGCIKTLKDIVMMGKDPEQFVSDFIWYLRNILIIKNSAENSEEMLEISRENAEQLKKEAEAISEEEIIRYINVFSELLGQIKFSPAKQIMTEVALVKLTKPQMENNYESLIARVSQLEDKLEKGDFKVMYSKADGEISQAEPVKELNIAVPEDVEWVARQRDRIEEGLGRLVKAWVKNGKFSSDGGNKLLIVFEKKSAIAIDTEQITSEVNNSIESILEKKVEVEVRILEEGENYNSKYKELPMVKMEIVEE